MSAKIKKIPISGEFESVDIPTMYEMSDQEYLEFIQNDGLMYVDHHEILRSSVAGYPLATTLEQIDILIKELQKTRSKLIPRTNK
jgi:hypothetical protein